MEAPKGLEGVVVCETKLSDVQAKGELTYRGLAIEQLVEQSFEEVVAHLLGQDVTPVLQQHANLTSAQSQAVLGLSRNLHPMKLLQSIVPLLNDGFSDGSAIELAGPADTDGVLALGCYVAAKMPAIVLTHLSGKAVRLDENAPYVQRFVDGLRECTAGEKANSVDYDACRVAQILQLEHSLNAGTFAARVVASTLARVDSAIAAGIGALSGPLHGGADQDVLEIVDQLADETAAIAWVEQMLDQGRKIPGMGHREYRARDPRAKCLYSWAQQMSDGSEHELTFKKLTTIERVFREHMQTKGKDLYANVEFYKGVVYRCIGLPNHYFTAGFAMARVFGYIAHYIENAQDNRIYRPAARYVGN